MTGAADALDRAEHDGYECAGTESDAARSQFHHGESGHQVDAEQKQGPSGSGVTPSRRFWQAAGASVKA